MIVGELAITDGTTTIDLRVGALRLVDWTPVTPPEKGGGVWNDSMLEDNRRPVMFKRGNAVETFQLRVVTGSQDDTIVEAQELRRLLEKAKDYWTTQWQNQPVWLVARGSCETNTRYAYIFNYVAERDDDPYQSPFYGSILSTMDEFSLQIERSDWLSHPPGQGACVAIGSQQTFGTDTDGDSFVPTESDDDCRVIMTTGVISLADTNAYLGADLSVDPIIHYASGIRFRNVTIPAGATITAAEIVMEANNNDATGSVRVHIYGDIDVNPPVFSTYADFVGRTKTDNYTVLSITGGWTAGLSYSSPRVTDIVQEIIDTGGWAAGNDMAFLIYDTPMATGYRRYCTWDSPAGAEPYLKVQWTEANDSYGRSATCADEVYIANKHNVAQITHAYHYDASLAAWSGNLIGAALPVAFLPAIPAASDLVYWGIDDALADSGPFSSIIFDIGTAANDILLYDLEYWTGAAWSPLNLNPISTIDQNPLGEYMNVTGVGSISFTQPSNWATVNIAAPGSPALAWYIRARIRAVGAAPTAPTQVNRDFYTVVRPSVDIDELQVPGDITALARVIVEDVAGTYNSQSVILATRSQDRGANFRMYLNFAGEQNALGVTAAAGTNTALTAYPESPTGWTMLYNPGATSTGDCTITLDQTIAAEYYGRYRAYVRVDRESAITDCTMQLKIGVQDSSGLYTSNYFESDTLTVASSAEAYLMDFGIVDIPGFGSMPDGETIMPIVFTLNLANTTATPNLYIYDLILIPIDEWAGEFIINDPDNNTAETIGIVNYPEYNYLDVDSLNQKRRISAYVRYSGASDAVQYKWKDITSAACQLQANADQQVFGIFRQWSASDDIWTAPVNGLGKLDITAAARYLSMRGNR